MIEICKEWSNTTQRCTACDNCVGFGCNVCIKGCATEHEVEAISCPSYPYIWEDKNE